MKRPRVREKSLFLHVIFVSIQIFISVVLSGGGCIMGCNPAPLSEEGGVVLTGGGPPADTSPPCEFHLCRFSNDISIS